MPEAWWDVCSSWWRNTVALLLLVGFCGHLAAATSTLVAEGSSAYSAADPLGTPTNPGACVSCHFTTPPTGPGLLDGQGSNHPQAANFFQLIRNAFRSATSVNLGLGFGVMTSYVGGLDAPGIDSPTAAQLDTMFKLSLYIGQFKAPVLSCSSLDFPVRAGQTMVKDIYPCVTADGSSGVARDSNGLSVNGTTTFPVTTTNASAISAAQVSNQPTIPSTLAYNISYSAKSTATGSETITVGVINPSGTGTKSVSVTTYGITSAATVTGIRGQTYNAGAPLYTITSNDPLVSLRTATVTSPAVTLASLGLSVDASGNIVGTITDSPTIPGTYTIDLGATISNTTVPGGGGTVSKTLTLTIGGITSSNPPTLTQDAAMSTYTVTAFPTLVTAGSFTMSSVPPGLSFNTANGQLTGTPTISGTYGNITFGATNAAGAISQGGFTITVNSAGQPNVITSSPALPASPVVLGTVNSVLSTTYQIQANRPPITGYAVTGLSATGLSVNASGLISGTPTSSGDFVLTLQATNSSGTGSATPVTVRIEPDVVPGVSASPPLAASPSLTGTVNTPITAIQIVATNPPITANSFVATGLPSGLSADPATGLITGTPTQSGDFLVTLRASNVRGQGSSTPVTIRIDPNAVPGITTNPLLVASPSVTGTVGSSIGTIQVLASNPPINTNSYAATGLPSGLNIDPATGAITGTPLQSGDFPVVLSAANARGTGSASITIRINPSAVPQISSSNAVTAFQNQAFAGYQIIASNAPITSYGVVAPSVLPAGLSLNTTTGAITGIPTASGSTTTNLIATNIVGPSTNFALNFTITPTTVPTVTAPLVAAPTATGSVGTAITPVQITATNPPITGYGATGLPTGLSVNGAGQLVGTPGLSGDFAITLTATNASGTGSTASTTIRIDPIVPPTITSLSTASGTVGATFGPYQILASQAPLTGFAVVAPSALPPGLSLNTTTGAITGTPTASGNFSTTLTASNKNGPGAGFVLSFSIAPNAVPVVTATIPTLAGTVGTPITPITVNATNPVITAYGASGLPSGLSVNGSGQIVGTPGQSGVFTVQLTATNSFGTGNSGNLSMRIDPNVVPVISGAATVTTGVSVPFAGYQITASQPTILSYAVVAPSALPPGLALNTATGAITGTPTLSGTYTTNLTATNAAGTSAPFSLGFTVLPNSVPVVTATIPPVAGTVGSAITAIQIITTNAPITGFSAAGLPNGLSVNGSGQIVGTPTQSGNFSVTLSATNASGTGNSAALAMLINPNAAPAITSAATLSGSVGVALTPYQIVASNAPVLSYALAGGSSLPAGLGLNTTSGQITGTPTTSGVFTTTLTATNAAGTGAPFTLTTTINPSTVPVISSPTFATVAAGAAITPIQVVATNVPILSYRATGLPAGLGINTSTGQITGTPTTPGSFSATLGATNVVGEGTRTVQFTIGIPAPTACALSVPLNTPTSLNLATCLFSGFAPTGVTIVATPQHGTAIANGTTVTYTPTQNFFGSDSFSFVGTGAGGTSPIGTVTVTVTGRPDPLQEAAVTATVAAQAETSQRFARAQVSNFQRRMEALHRGAGTVSPSGGALQSAAPPTVPGLAGSGFSSAAAAVAAPVTRAGNGSTLAGVAGTPAVPATSILPRSAQAVPVGQGGTTGAALALPRTIGTESTGRLMLSSTAAVASPRSRTTDVPLTRSTVTVRHGTESCSSRQSCRYRRNIGSK